MMKIDKKQQKKLEDFFKEENTWFPGPMGYKMVSIIILGITMLLFLLPYQIWELPEDGITIFLMYALEMMGFSYYIMQYTHYSEEKKNKSLSNIFKNLPVSRRQMAIYRVRKAVGICKWLAGITIIVQSLCAIAFMKTFSIGNIAFPLVFQFVLPVALAGSGILSKE